AALAELALALREERPQPSADFASALDDRASSGFRSAASEARSGAQAGGALGTRPLAGRRPTGRRPRWPLPRRRLAAGLGAGSAIERTATLDVGVSRRSIQSTAGRVFTLASAFGGYVRQSSVSSGSSGEDGASFDVRLPSARLSAAIAALSHLGHVRSETDTTNDVTDQLGALRRALDDLRAERASVLKQLSAAPSAERV